MLRLRLGDSAGEAPPAGPGPHRVDERRLIPEACITMARSLAA